MPDKIKIDRKNKIGEGRHASIYKQRLTRNNREVAVRWPKEKNVFNPLLYELEHPNILPVLEISEASYFLRKKFVEVYPAMDCSLTQIILNPFTALNLMKQVIQGVEYLHARNIVHKDLRPRNILLHNQTIETNETSERTLLPEKFWVAMISDFTIAFEDPDGEFFKTDYKEILSTLWYCLEAFFLKREGCSLAERIADQSECDYIVEDSTPLRRYLPMGFVHKFVDLYRNENLCLDDVKRFFCELEIYFAPSES